MMLWNPEWGCVSVGVVDPLLEKAFADTDGPVQGVAAQERWQIPVREYLGRRKGVTFGSLPKAGVIATESQVEDIDASR